MVFNPGAAAQGGLLSGANIKSITITVKNQAMPRVYGNAYNRFNADQTNRYNRLYQTLVVGQNAAAQVVTQALKHLKADCNTMAVQSQLQLGQVASANNLGQIQQTILAAWLQVTQ